MKSDGQISLALAGSASTTAVTRAEAVASGQPRRREVIRSAPAGTGSCAVQRADRRSAVAVSAPIRREVSTDRCPPLVPAGRQPEDGRAVTVGRIPGCPEGARASTTRGQGSGGRRQHQPAPLGRPGGAAQPPARLVETRRRARRRLESHRSVGATSPVPLGPRLSDERTATARFGRLNAAAEQITARTTSAPPPVQI